jgi:3-hydroxyacyl-CoA dehydrogenase
MDQMTTTEFGPVRLSRADDVAVIEIDSPPVNATSQAVRAGLIAAVRAADAEADVRAIVIAAAGRTFVAGGDITEFGKTPLEPHLPDVVNRIEACRKPVVVAWHGTALGGGCEIGLAAHARVMDAKALVGLPEVKLGLCPGSGGTQRLPRLVGLANAIEIASSGRMLGAAEAKGLGLADAVSDGDVRAAAIAHARGLIDQPLRRTGDRPVGPEAPDSLGEVLGKVAKDARGRIAPERIAELVRTAAMLPLAEGMAVERKAFFDLMGSDQSKALRHAFFAERAAAKVAGIDGTTARPVNQIGVIGAGTMGAGIAVAFLDAGFAVTVIETADQALANGQARIEALFDRSVKSGRITPETKATRLGRARFSTDLAALSHADLIVEAVFEDMTVKKELLGRLEAVTRQEAILATNTSYLDIDAMAADLARPQNVVGLHFFSPANVMKLMEIVRARKTAPDVLATAVAVGKALKKIAVVCGVCDGFIGNRILSKYRAQCEFMLEEGALPQEIDAALEAYGFPMGPFAVSDLAGLDISWARRKRLAPTRPAGERYVPIADRLCEAGRFGQKTGAGWYRYVDGKRTVDPDVTEIVLDHARARGISRRPIGAEEIQARVLAAMVNEGTKILAEGVAQRPSDIDVVMMNGYGYPAWRGGPMHEADRVGLPAILKTVKAMQGRDGTGFEPSVLLIEIAAEGGSLSQLNTTPP